MANLNQEPNIVNQFKLWTESWIMTCPGVLPWNMARCPLDFHCPLSSHSLIGWEAIKWFAVVIRLATWNTAVMTSSLYLSFLAWARLQVKMATMWMCSVSTLFYNCAKKNVIGKLINNISAYIYQIEVFYLNHSLKRHNRHFSGIKNRWISEWGLYEE